MAGSVPHPTPIYHITDLSNLPSIVAQGLLSHNECALRMAQHSTIANAEIQERRARRVVTAAAGGTLHDYVPFFFCKRPPMLLWLRDHDLPNRPRGQSTIIHLVSTLEEVVSSGAPWLFTSGHAIMEPFEEYATVAQLKEIDWPLMANNFWANSEEQPDRQRRKQAEFLVHKAVPWPRIHSIGVYNLPVKSQVEALLTGARHRPPVQVRPQWYYDPRPEVTR